MLLVRLSHGNSRKRHLIFRFGTAGAAVKDGTVVLVDNSFERIKTIDKILANFKLLSVASVLDVAAGILVPPL